MNNLFFKPWISDAYKNKRGIYGQLLILGESHYTDNKATYDESQIDLGLPVEEFQENIKKNSFENFTSEIVEEFINNDNNISFFRNLGLLFNQNDKTEVWNNVAFANGIQSFLLNSNGQPNSYEIATVKSAFWTLLNSLQPDRLLVCSQRMWNYWLPDNDERGHFLKHHNKAGKHSTIWKYNRNGGNTYGMAINHPSKYFSYTNWEPLVKSFIDEDFESFI